MAAGEAKAGRAAQRAAVGATQCSTHCMFRSKSKTQNAERRVHTYVGEWTVVMLGGCTRLGARSCTVVKVVGVEPPDFGVGLVQKILTPAARGYDRNEYK